ncbi:MAG: alpha/beta fold hydrolase [Parachlamydia sp.]|nr:alpha/beta fold hydrolase [Parachlamydia sp.]
MIQKLDFRPLWGITSPHFHLIVPAYLPAGKPPASEQWLVDIGNHDRLSCEVSTPDGWKIGDPTVALLHGLGGCHTSRYMVRMARKLIQRGFKVLWINLRGSGSGKGLSLLPYSAGNSADVLHVVQKLKQETPESELTLIGFSLGGNIALKLAGELGEEAGKFLKQVIAVCPSINLAQTTRWIQRKGNFLYHRYYLKHLLEQARPWVKENFHSIYAYDDKVTGPLWGFSGADEYYQKCSSKFFIDKIRCPTRLLFAEDDLFVSMECLEEISIPSQVEIYATQHGSHMGFLGQTNQPWDPFWMDQLLLSWV